VKKKIAKTRSKIGRFSDVGLGVAKAAGNVLGAGEGGRHKLVSKSGVKFPPMVD